MLFLNEEELSKEEREKLDDDQFGIPEKRKFPLHDEEHVRKAIQFFYHAKGKDKEILAKNIIKKADEYDINISDDSELGEYIEKNDLK
jgi:hypothetical protein